MPFVYYSIVLVVANYNMGIPLYINMGIPIKRTMELIIKEVEQLQIIENSRKELYLC
jgi:hypothetical protein